ncbi:unnamed protein product [Cladocopium goreaui]|uniref:tyrosine--tRNA ligase n=1 Tax=Cladocopium goreaui TaxID=2562237 RepID=A0A9P1FV30_9DINO|nr:unnamed protein product [Cladocopium goreaui]
MAAVSPRPWISTGGSLLRPFRPAQSKGQSHRATWILERSCGLAVAGSIACRLAARGSRRAVASASTLRMAVAVESAEDWTVNPVEDLGHFSMMVNYLLVGGFLWILPGLRQDVSTKSEESSASWKYELIRSVGEECQTEAELRKLVEKKPNFVCYDGFEPSGRMHIAQGVYKSVCVNKCTKAGGQFIFWVADWFALMNDKMGGCNKSCLRMFFHVSQLEGELSRQ